MKKVISALTAAAMCASMSAGVINVFAEYTADNTSFYLKVVEASAGTISEDGSTVTFASAADAKGAKLVVQEFIKADTANPSVQQVGSTFSVSDKAITLGDGIDYSEPVGEEKSYTIGDKTFSTDLFVNCFGYVNKRGKYVKGCGQASWGHSSEWTWEYSGVDVYSLIWASDFGDTSRDNYEQTAAFLSATSDELPFTQFGATIGDVADGTYTIDILDSWNHAENGKQDGAFINTDGKKKLLITEHPGITIKVGDAAATPSEEKPSEEKPSEEKPSEEKPSEEKPSEEKPSEEKPSEENPSVDPGTSTTPSLDDKKNSATWTWYLDDVWYDPATDDDGCAEMHIYVTKDEGTFGYNFTLTIDGKTIDEAGWELDIEQTSVYKLDPFQANKKKGIIGGASKTKDADGNAVDTVAKDGDAILDLYLTPPDTVKEGEKYIVSLKDLTVGDASDVKHKPDVIAGSITIGKEGETVVTPSEETPSEEKPSEETPSEEKPSEEKPSEETPSEEKPSEQTPSDDKPSTDVKYLYGDVNEDGKVELVDVVKLNRHLTGIDKTLSAVATVNANCMRDKGESDADTTDADLNGKDSVEILRFLINLVTTLPTKA